MGREIDKARDSLMGEVPHPDEMANFAGREREIRDQYERRHREDCEALGVPTSTTPEALDRIEARAREIAEEEAARRLARR